MFENLQTLLQKLDEINEHMSQPDAARDPEEWKKLMKERSRIEPICACYEEYVKADKDFEEARQLLSSDDDEMKQLAREEMASAQERRKKAQEELTRKLTPQDENDEKDVYMELRAGAGGEEAALFASDLYRMYTRYAERKGWKTTFVSANESGLGGFKEIIFKVEGNLVYSHLKFESGVHLVKRVPVTESSGRIQTSTVTVAVMPEAEEVEVEIRPEDLRVDVYRSSGHGGQSVNTTDSAVRVTHLPTGLVVTCQDEKSQLKNKDAAIRVLRARLLAMKTQEQHEELADIKRRQVGTGERSEKIRTYHFLQNRITDYRIGYTTHRVKEFMDGDMDEIIRRLMEDDQTRRAASQE